MNWSQKVQFMGKGSGIMVLILLVMIGFTKSCDLVSSQSNIGSLSGIILFGAACAGAVLAAISIYELVLEMAEYLENTTKKEKE
jgi:hypothetical protein